MTTAMIRFRNSVCLLTLFCALSLPASAQPFPARGDDTDTSKGIFKVTLTAFGGATFVEKVSGPFCVSRSSAHLQTTDPSATMLGDGSLCPGSPFPPTSDAMIGPAPPGFNIGGGPDEVHTIMADMSLSSTSGLTIVAGASASGLTAPSFGEVEARGGGAGAGQLLPGSRGRELHCPR